MAGASACGDSRGGWRRSRNAARRSTFLICMKKYLPFLIILLVLVAGLGVAATLWKRSTPATPQDQGPFAGNAPSPGPNSATTNVTNPRAGSTNLNPTDP